ncbi:hypothetical protein NIE111_001287 [Micromonospora sp. NIE111]|nr:hypothetical protein [Micromonospora hortensis]
MKTTEGFDHTHLGRIGKARRAQPGGPGPTSSGAPKRSPA